MKKHYLKFAAIAFVLALFGLASCIKAQSPTLVAPPQKSSITAAPNAKLDASGNYVAIQKVKVQAQPTPTGKTFTDTKGNTYPVWITPKGKLFYTRVSKQTGNEYPVYITLAQ